MTDRSSEIAGLVSKIEGNVALLEEGHPDVTLPGVNEELREAEALVAQFDVTARASGDDSGRHAARLMRSVLSGLKDRIARFALVGRPTGNVQERDFHDDFIQTNARLESSTERLLDSRRTLMDTEGVAGGIAEDLATQRGTIESSRGKLLETGGMFGRAHRAMRAMEKRETRNKVCVYVAVAVVVLAIFAAVVRVLAPSSTVVVVTPAPTSAAPTAPTAPPRSPTNAPSGRALTDAPSASTGGSRRRLRKSRDV